MEFAEFNKFFDSDSSNEKTRMSYIRELSSSGSRTDVNLLLYIVAPMYAEFLKVSKPQRRTSTHGELSNTGVVVLGNCMNE